MSADEGGRTARATDGAGDGCVPRLLPVRSFAKFIQNLSAIPGHVGQIELARINYKRE